EVDLRFSHALLEKQRAILERLDHAVGIGLDERGDAIEQLERHGSPPLPYLAPTRRSSRAIALCALLSSFCRPAWFSPRKTAATSDSSWPSESSFFCTSADCSRSFRAAFSARNCSTFSRAASRRPAFTSRATSACILL